MIKYNSLIRNYKIKKNEIKNRIREFREIFDKKDKELFFELCFCILTPQSKAINCAKAIENLIKSNLLLKGNKAQIRSKLKGIRFSNNKADYIVAARSSFKNSGGVIKMKNKIDINDIYKTRDWFVKNIKGLGYKESSHFLRNIGLGYDIAILDRHILRNLEKYKVIKNIPVSMSKKKYLIIEDKFRKFSKKINISMEELDLLFWSLETGFIFK